MEVFEDPEDSLHGLPAVPVRRLRRGGLEFRRGLEDTTRNGPRDALLPRVHPVPEEKHVRVKSVRKARDHVRPDSRGLESLDIRKGPFVSADVRVSTKESGPNLLPNERLQLEVRNGSSDVRHHPVVSASLEESRVKDSLHEDHFRETGRACSVEIEWRGLRSFTRESDGLRPSLGRDMLSPSSIERERPPSRIKPRDEDVSLELLPQDGGLLHVSGVRSGLPERLTHHGHGAVIPEAEGPDFLVRESSLRTHQIGPREGSLLRVPEVFLRRPDDSLQDAPPGLSETNGLQLLRCVLLLWEGESHEVRHLPEEIDEVLSAWSTGLPVQTVEVVKRSSSVLTPGAVPLKGPFLHGERGPGLALVEGTPALPLRPALVPWLVSGMREDVLHREPWEDLVVQEVSEGSAHKSSS
ncbi:MAG: hypothetical protein BWY86_00256 [Candidatus Aminicenantes bacterium ADurb.Bin508]|nr:MAG: hypothetical protein BWY86_00256 [Candidatus Aminicenantes bacterium ADurb.Bin508]